MKALALRPGTTTVRLVDRPEPRIIAPDDVKAQMISVGICGTDREETAGGRARAPEGQKELIIGHEMFGRVIEVGGRVTHLRAGDYCVFTVRRGCGACRPCAMNRSDMCQTGQYQERGIWGMDGYDTAFALDKEQYIVRVPPELERIGVLTEPTSVVEKAIEEAARIQSVRLPDVATPGQWLTGRRCLVAGLGPIGLLGAMALRLRGADVYGIDIVDEGSSRPQWLSAIGGHYIDGRQVRIDQRDGAMGRFDLILEAAGIASLDFSLLDALATNGAYVLTGIPGESRPLQISGAELMRRLVLNNQVVIGSVNAARDHFQLAVNDLTEAHHRWGSLTERLITHRHPFTDFAAALGHHPAEEIKSTLEWTTTEHP